MRHAILRRRTKAWALLVDQPSGRRQRTGLSDHRRPSRTCAGSLASEAQVLPGPNGPIGRHGHGRQRSLAGRSHAKLQSALAPPCRLPAWWRAGRPVLDRPRRDRSLVPYRRPAANRCDGRLGRVDNPPAPAARSADRRAADSPAAFMLHWARELVVDRTVLVYAPPLHDRIGPRLGPVHLFADQTALWHAAAKTLARNTRGSGSAIQPSSPYGCASSPREA